MSRTNRLPQEILEASIDLFAANGFRGTSIRDIGKAVSTTISNIYYHFGSKEGLLLAILERSSHHIVEKLRQVTERDLDPLERFKLLLKTHLRLLLELYRKEAKILFIEEEHLARVRKEFQLEILNLYRTELEHLKSMGYISFENITVLAFNILGVINWHQRWCKPEGRMSLEQIGDEMVKFVLNGALGPCQCPPHSLKSGPIY